MIEFRKQLLPLLAALTLAGCGSSESGDDDDAAAGDDAAGNDDDTATGDDATASDDDAGTADDATGDDAEGDDAEGDDAAGDDAAGDDAAGDDAAGDDDDDDSGLGPGEVLDDKGKVVTCPTDVPGSVECLTGCGNELRVGMPCTEGGGECSKNIARKVGGLLVAFMCTVDAAETDLAFCTKACVKDEDCGSNAYCTGDPEEQSAGRGCFPTACE